MDFLTLAKERYSVRKFDSRPVEQQKIDSILRVAQLAPTAKNNQPQRILVIRGEKALAKLKECTPSHFNAPLAFLICADKLCAWERPYDGKSSAEIDASIAASHMMLQAQDLGLGSTWVMYFEPNQMRTAYRIPAHFEPVALLVMGYPAADAEPSERHPSRLPIEKLAWIDEFDLQG